MLTCKACKQNLNSIKDFFTHIKYLHPHIIRLACPYPNCSRFYSNRGSLRCHVSNTKIHSNIGGTEPSTSEQSLLTDKCTPFMMVCEDETKTKVENTSENENVSKIIADLKTDMMKNAVDLLADELISRKKSMEILKKSFELYSKAVLSMKKCDQPLNNQNFNEFCEFFADPSSNKSEYKLRKALQSAGVFIASKDYILSRKNDLRYLNGVPKLIKDTRIVKTFNVTEFLEKFLNLPGIMYEIDTFIKSKQNCDDGSISNIIQSPLWLKLISVEEKDDSTLYLPLNIFFDDFEPQNVIGSHSGAYKVGSVYMGMPALPDHMISKLDFIFPLCQFFSEDRKTYGNQEVFKPIIKILNDLHSSGVNVKYGKIRNVKFIVALILGDNLGLNDILGFTDCFNANFYCRFCKLKKIVMQKLLFEDSKFSRNFQNYREDVSTEDLSLTGIKYECVFNQLHKFHVTRNFSVDILHDFFEGVCNYDLSNIIINLINKNFFTLEELNANIKYHDYGPFVKNKKIDSITVQNLENVSIRTSGEEMKTLILNFAAIIGHRIPHDCTEWKLYLVLRQIVTIVTSKTIHIRTHELLANLVSEHHELYLLCFPYDTLKPKHHFMVHYPKIMCMVGPISLISSMRYEAYHKKFKNVANVISCRINLLTTFATKAEYQISKFFLNFEGTENKPNFCKMDQIDLYSTFKKYNFFFDIKNVELLSWVQLGVLIKKNCVVQTGLEIDDSPKFAIVKDIIYIDKSIVLLGCQKLENLGFDRHVYAYSVLETNNCFMFSAEKIHNVTYMYQGNKNQKFVCLN